MKKKIFNMQKTLLSSAILWAIGSAHAATIYVTDSCTLVDAMVAANTDTVTGSCVAGSGSDTIRVVLLSILFLSHPQMAPVMWVCPL